MRGAVESAIAVEGYILPLVPMPRRTTEVVKLWVDIAADTKRKHHDSSKRFYAGDGARNTYACDGASSPPSPAELRRASKRATTNSESLLRIIALCESGACSSLEIQLETLLLALHLNAR